MNNAPPPRTAAPGHRRAQSDTTFLFSSSSDMEDDDFLFDMDTFNLSSLDLVSPSPLPTAKSADSADADLFDGIPFGGERRVHRRTSSMDGGGSCSSSIDGGDGDGFVIIDGVKKAMPPEKLAELALIDPKRAKRLVRVYVICL